MKAVSAAFLSGPMYDPLYSHESIISAAESRGLRVDFCCDHPALNRHLSTLTEIPCALISTHTKYAPSQAHFLAPLDRLPISTALQSITQQIRQIVEAPHCP